MNLNEILPAFVKEAMALTNLSRMAQNSVRSGVGMATVKGGGTVMRARNPTLHMATQAAGGYAGLPQATRTAIESSDAVKKWGVHPHAAAALAGASMKPGQTIHDVIKSAAAHLKEKASNMVAGNYGPNSQSKGLPGVIDNKAPALMPKVGGVAAMVGKGMAGKPGIASRVGNHLVNHGDKYDLAGLGLLAAPSAATLGKQVQNKAQGRPVDRHQVGHDLAELGGLGLIAAPVAAGALLGRKH